MWCEFSSKFDFISYVYNVKIQINGKHLIIRKIVNTASILTANKEEHH